MPRTSAALVRFPLLDLRVLKIKVLRNKSLDFFREEPTFSPTRAGEASKRNTSGSNSSLSYNTFVWVVITHKFRNQSLVQIFKGLIFRTVVLHEMVQ
jgi:hypothetical protein